MAVDTVNLANFTDWTSFVQTTMEPEVDKYGNYWYYCGIVLSCFLLLIVAFMYLGLCFGACGETAGDDAGSCNRGIGAGLLLAGVAFIFIFSWLLMIAVTVLFVSGGLPYTEVCRPLSQPEPNSSIYKAIDWAVGVSIRDYDVAFTYANVMESCKANDGLYSALNLDQSFNLTSQFADMTTRLNSSMGDLIAKVGGNVTVNQQLVTPDVKNLFNQIQNSGIDRINFTTFDVILSSPVLTINLSSLADSLEQAASLSIMDFTDQAILLNESRKLRGINDNDLPLISQHTASLRLILVKLKSEVQPSVNQTGILNQTEALLDILLVTQNFVQINGTAALRQFVSDFAYGLFNTVTSSLSDILTQIQHGIGQCQTLYDSVQIVTHAACSTVLDPLNGFWFSVGWCLAFFIPTVVLSLYLATLYRAVDEYHTSDSKSFDEHIRQRRGRVHPVSGHHNTVYEPDINPPPPATLYGPHSAANRSVSNRSDLVPRSPGPADSDFILPSYSAIPPSNGSFKPARGRYINKNR